jgi:hypothetical protein
LQKKKTHDRNAYPIHVKDIHFFIPKYTKIWGFGTNVYLPYSTFRVGCSSLFGQSLATFLPQDDCREADSAKVWRLFFCRIICREREEKPFREIQYLPTQTLWTSTSRKHTKGQCYKNNEGLPDVSGEDKVICRYIIKV